MRGFNFWGTRSDAAFMPEYQKIGLNLLRFPSGQAGDQEPVSQELITDSAKVMKAVGGDLVVEVQLRGGTPEQAAKSVRYANVEKKYGARFWEVGNEPDLYPQRIGEPHFSPAWYNERFRAYAQAMKAEDPSIKIFGPVLSNKLDDLQGFNAAAPVRIWRHDKQTPGASSEYAGPLAPLDISLPPYSTTMLVIPARSGLPTPLFWAGAGGAALLAGLAAWRLRRARGR